MIRWPSATELPDGAVVGDGLSDERGAVGRALWRYLNRGAKKAKEDLS